MDSRLLAKVSRNFSSNAEASLVRTLNLVILPDCLGACYCGFIGIYLKACIVYVFVESNIRCNTIHRPNEKFADVVFLYKNHKIWLLPK